jgi:hypothetical protein
MVYRASAVFAVLTWTSRWWRKLLGLGALVAAGVAIADLIRFAPGWQFYGALPLLIILGGVCFSLIPQQRLRDLYEPGSQVKVLVKGGEFFLELNGHRFLQRTEDVVTIRKFGAVSAIGFSDFNFLLLPTEWMPHVTPVLDRAQGTS